LYLGLEGDEHVADAMLDEGGSRSAPAGVEHRHIGEELAHELFGLLLISLVRLERIGVRRKIGIAAIARCLGFREHDLDVIANEIAPVLDVLRIALANEKGRQRVKGNRIVGKARLPICRDQIALSVQDLNVSDLIERHHIGLKPIQHRARLL
jgi:hypothetical protein